MNTIKNTSPKHSVVQINATTLGGDTSRCHNLKASPDGNRLVPTIMPREIIKGNYTPIHHFPHPDGSTTIFLLSGNTLSTTLFTNDTATSPSEVATLPCTPRCGINSNNSVLLMTNDGPYRIDYNPTTNSWIDLGYMPQLPAIKITATNITNISSSTAPSTLSDSYSHWQGSLNKADNKTLTTTLLNAYDSIKQLANDAGFFIQPILARYHLLDSQRNILYSSSPTMIASPSGFQCITPITLTASDLTQINSATLHAEAFQLNIETQPLHNSPWSEIVDTVVVETTPIIDPINPSASAQCRLELIDTTSRIISAYMPGTSVTMSASNTYRTSLIKKFLSTFCKIASSLAQISHPFVNGFSKTYSPGAQLQDAITPTNGRFSAHSATQSGSCVLWGDIAFLPQFAPSIGDIAASTDINSGFWRAFVSVEFDDNDSVIVWSGEGSNNCPTTFTPLLSYPDSHATKITIATSCNGIVMRQSFPLTPLPHHNSAYYLHPSLAPFALSDTAQSFIIPSQHHTPTTQIGTLGAALIDSPLSLITHRKICEGEIVAITPAVRTTSSWDFGRTHIYAFTTVGTFASSINPSRATITSHVIDNRSISTPQSVTYANNAVYAIASSDLIAISGARAKSIAIDTPLKSLSWDNNTHILYASTGDKLTYLYDLTQKHTSTCDLLDDCNLYCTPANTLIYNTDGISVLNDTTTPSTIEWTHTLTIANPHQRLALASIYISASQFIGTISIRAHGGAGDDNSYPITTLNISGAINVPIPIKMQAPHRPHITLSIKGVATPDFSFHNAQLYFKY